MCYSSNMLNHLDFLAQSYQYKHSIQGSIVVPWLTSLSNVKQAIKTIEFD